MKRKVGLIVGYNGSGFHGLQMNKDIYTIEFVVMKTLLELDLVSQINSTDPTKISLKSSSRTDKGVHALFNVINLKICKEPSQEIENQLREKLADYNIHLYKMIRLPKKFIGYKSARSRIYKYVVPTYFLKEGSYMEESQKIKDNYKEDKYKEEFTTDVKIPEEIYGYKSPDIELFKNTIKKYIGTHNFKNFTIKKTENDTKRFIRNITVSEPFIYDEIEYIEIKLHGQSFLLHQIRKMVCFVVLNIKYARNKIDENFNIGFNGELHIPKAPAEYLYLADVFFDDFNKKATEKIYVPEEEKDEYENRVIKKIIYKKENTCEWIKLLNAIRIHDENFEIFKK